MQEFYVHSEMEIRLIPPSYYERAPQKTSLLKERDSSFIIGTDAHAHIHADTRISPMSHINVIIAAGGSSLRYGKENKLLEPCGSSCVLVEAVKPFLAFPEVKRVIIAVDTDSADEFLDSLSAAHLDEDRRITLTRGGASRTKTVRFGLQALDEECDLVLIHDGARPFVTGQLIARVIDGAEKCGACIPALPFTDNILRLTDGGAEPLDRTDYRRVQTPAGFSRERIEKAYSLCEEDCLDDFTVAHKYAPGEVLITEGDPKNVKITVKDDLRTSLVGFGYDIHKLTAGKGIKLLGERIPCPYSFVAHSDGDAAIHAVMDAILSALGEKDIGHLYPVDDPKYDGADSMKLLKGVLRIMHDKGRSVASLSVCIIAEKPVIAPHIDRMRARMASALSLPADKIGITATTNEGVGDIGSAEAIAACAYVLLQ